MPHLLFFKVFKCPILEEHVGLISVFEFRLHPEFLGFQQGVQKLGMVYK